MSGSLQVAVAPPDTDPARVAAPIVTSFSNDPFVRWLLPETGKYLKHFGGIARSHAAIALAAGSARQTHDFKASAIWFPPGTQASPEAGQAFFDGIPEHRRETALAVFAEMGASHPAEPCWHLRMLGADPPVQGMGYGSLLLTASLRELDELAVAGYLESTSAASRRLYERHGFTVTREIQIGDSPPLWPMVRKAR